MIHINNLSWRWWIDEVTINKNTSKIIRRILFWKPKFWPSENMANSLKNRRISSVLNMSPKVISYVVWVCFALKAVQQFADPLWTWNLNNTDDSRFFAMIIIECWEFVPIISSKKFWSFIYKIIIKGWQSISNSFRDLFSKMCCMTM